MDYCIKHGLRGLDDAVCEGCHLDLVAELANTVEDRDLWKKRAEVAEEVKSKLLALPMAKLLDQERARSASLQMRVVELTSQVESCGDAINEARRTIARLEQEKKT
jgi:predicted  nucleic acid-binding Zn-ribbon protein